MLTYYSKFEIYDKKLFAKIISNNTEYKWEYRDYKTVLKLRKVDFLFLDGWDLFDKSLWHISSVWKNRITVPIITNKYLLHELLLSPLAASYSPSSFIPHTYLIGNTIPRNIDWSHDNMWIWRTDNRVGHGHNVCVITSAAELAKIHAKFMKQRRNNIYFGENALLSKYISSPLLLPHKNSLYKFHLRIYYIITVNLSAIKFGVYRNGSMGASDLPYTNTDFSNNKIHLTTSHDYYSVFPADFIAKFSAATYESVYAQIKNILTVISKLTASYIKPYAEAANCFHVYGCDFLVDSDYRVMLLEINISPGADAPTLDTKRTMSAETIYKQTTMLNGICEFVIQSTDSAAAKYVDLLYTHLPARHHSHH